MDNLPTHKIDGVRQAIEAVRAKLRYLPAYSPDLNPIEHLWNEVERRLRHLPERAMSKKDLWIKLQHVWNRIELDFLTKLIESMLERVRAVIKAKGGYTKW